MKWRVSWKSQMDCNDADYAYEEGEYGIVDDEKLKDMQDLVLEVVATEFYCEQFDDGSADFDDEELIAHLKADRTIQRLMIPCEKIEEFAGGWDGWDYKPSDPTGWGGGHDLCVSWSRLPADVQEKDVSDNWLTTPIRLQKEKEKEEKEAAKKAE